MQINPLTAMSGKEACPVISMSVARKCSRNILACNVMSTSLKEGIVARSACSVCSHHSCRKLLNVFPSSSCIDGALGPLLGPTIVRGSRDHLHA